MQKNTIEDYTDDELKRIVTRELSDDEFIELKKNLRELTPDEFKRWIELSMRLRELNDAAEKEKEMSREERKAFRGEAMLTAMNLASLEGRC